MKGPAEEPKQPQGNIQKVFNDVDFKIFEKLLLADK